MTTWIHDEGEGEPVVLLHGAFSDSDSLIPLFAGRLGDRYRIVAFDRRGHGRTPDSPEPFHYESMADETIAVLEQVGQPAHLIGYSDGGIVSLHVARRCPELVRSLVLIGTNYHVDGLMPDWLDDDESTMAFLQAGYAAVSPDGGGHFPIVAEKTTAMFTTEPTMTEDDLRALTMPALVLVGDDDAVRHGHTVSLYESIPNAQLAVVPGTSHLVFVEKPVLVGMLVDDFLSTNGAVSTFLPVRRRT